jgi:hypothetical protein
LAAGLVVGSAVYAAPPVKGRDEPVIIRGNVTVYGPGYFAAARPDNALDMVQLIPGFSIETETATRGLGDVNGNVLIDRVRPPKTSSVNAELQRISADSVAAIILYRGATPGVDLGGFSMAVDVIRKAGSKFHGSMSLAVGADAQSGNNQALTVDASHGRKRARQSINLSVSRQAASTIGHHRVEQADGIKLAESGESETHRRSESLSPSADLPIGPHTAVAINGSVSRTRASNNEQWSGDPAGILASAFVSDLSSRTMRGTVEIRHTPPRGVQVTGTFSFSDQRSSNSSYSGAGVRFSSDSRARERAGRIVGQYAASRMLAIESGVDYAFNGFDANAALVSPSGPILIPNSDIGVSEKRLGGYAALSWSLGDFSGQARFRADRATLVALGSRRDRRLFFDLRPKVELGLAIDDSTKIDLSIEREVDQLPFALFAASAKLADGTVKAGAGRVDPERGWAVEANVQKGFWGHGILTLTARGEAIANPIGLVVTAGGFDATGNLESAQRLTVQSGVILALDRVGLHGGKLDMSQSLVRSRVTDPVTGKKRALAGDRQWTWSVGLRQDLAKTPISWGLSASGGSPIYDYRLTEVQHSNADPAFSAFVEFKPRPHLSLQVDAAYGGNLKTTREIHDGPRDSAPLLAFDHRDASRPVSAILTVRVTT